MANYPGSAPSFTAKSPGNTITSAGINAIADEVVAIGSALLTGLAHGLTVNGQIAFPATQNASANANTLDDYEENTFTPVIGGAGGTSGQAYSVQSGYYQKVGKKVTVWYRAVLSTKGTITGQAQIQGLPFTVLADANYAPSGECVWANTTTPMTKLSAVGAQNTTAASLFYVGAAATGVTAVTTADIGNTTEINGTLQYFATA